MGRYAPAAFALFLMLQNHIAAVAGEVKPHPSTSSGSFAENVRALVGSPVQKLGKSTATVVAALGQPLSIISEDIANKHQPSQIDRIKTINYEGLVISIYDVVAFEKEMLLSVRMAKNRLGVLPVLIGQNEKMIKAKYGDPERVKGMIFEYVLSDIDDPGEDIVSIKLQNSIVVGVEWSYYVD